ncbi:tetratricopeptide repeat protein, partial [[Phormidium ambiguum] IAM M-71]
QQKLPQAITIYRRVIALDKQNPNAYYNLGVAFARQRKVKDALSTFNYARSLYLSQGDNERAQQVDAAIRQLQM